MRPLLVLTLLLPSLSHAQHIPRVLLDPHDHDAAWEVRAANLRALETRNPAIADGASLPSDPRPGSVGVRRQPSPSDGLTARVTQPDHAGTSCEGPHRSTERPASQVLLAQRDPQPGTPSTIAPPAAIAPAPTIPQASADSANAVPSGAANLTAPVVEDCTRCLKGAVAAAGKPFPVWATVAISVAASGLAVLDHWLIVRAQP